MRKFEAIIVLADISGYTNFVVMHRHALTHAEQIITELMEAVTRKATFPLELQKLEGDAAFFTAEITGAVDEAVRDVVRQVVILMEMFRKKQQELHTKSIGGCPCAACQAIEMLDLKCILHTGEVLEKRVAEHVEIVGEPVIVAHKLMKNSVCSDAYILVTDVIEKALNFAPYPGKEDRDETVEGIGTVRTTAYLVSKPALQRHGVRPLTRPKGVLEAMRIMLLSFYNRFRKQRPTFRNLSL